MRDNRETGDYEVGYGKPPKSGQFKKGVSGNPSGRGKEASGFGSKLLRELKTKVTINEKGEQKTITKLDLIAKHWVNKAAGGNLAAARLILPHYQQELENLAVEERLANRLVEELSDEELTRLIRTHNPELE